MRAPSRSRLNPDFGASSRVSRAGTGRSRGLGVDRHSSTTPFQRGTKSRPSLDTEAVKVTPVPDVSGSGRPETRKSGPIRTR